MLGPWATRRISFSPGLKQSQGSNYLMDTTCHAFSLVNPRRVPQALARLGLVSQEAADRVSWRGEIQAYLTAEDIRREGLTPKIIAEAILAMTGTEAKIIPCIVHGTPWISYWPRPGRRGYIFLADGFSKGPGGTLLTPRAPAG